MDVAVWIAFGAAVVATVLMAVYGWRFLSDSSESGPRGGKGQ